MFARYICFMNALLLNNLNEIPNGFVPETALWAGIVALVLVSVPAVVAAISAATGRLSRKVIVGVVVAAALILPISMFLVHEVKDYGGTASVASSAVAYEDDEGNMYRYILDDGGAVMSRDKVDISEYPTEVAFAGCLPSQQKGLESTLECDEAVPTR